MNLLKKLTSLIKTPQSTFWLFQNIIWFAYFIIHLSGQTTTPSSHSYIKIIYSLIAALAGFIISLLFLKPIYKFTYDNKNFHFFILSFISLLIASAFLTIIKASVYSLFFGGDWLLYRQHFYHTNNLFVLLLTDYFANSMLLLLWSLFYFMIYFIFTIEDEKHTRIIEQKLSIESKLLMLRYQLNPHFLFNTLNTIATLLLQKKDNTAYKMIINLAKFLRKSLSNDRKITISLGEEVEDIYTYLEIEKQRFGDKLIIKNSIGKEYNSLLIPPMLLQPIVENALKHAITKNNNQGTIYLDVKLNENNYSVLIDDSGYQPISSNILMKLNNKQQPISENSENISGIGLINIKQRLQYIYGDKAFVEYSQSLKGGLNVKITLPYKYDTLTIDDQS